jgi:methyl-accepting chemotaxis protein
MKHFRISVRLYALVGLALLTMAAVMMLGLFQEQDKLVAQRKAMLEAMNERRRRPRM